MTVLQCFKNFAYNLDRAAASLFGADPQATISSEVGRHAAKKAFMAREVSALLDAVDSGHTANAVMHAGWLKTAIEQAVRQEPVKK